MTNEPPLFEDTQEQVVQPVLVPTPGPAQTTNPSNTRILMIAGGVIAFGISMLLVWRLLTPPPKPAIQTVQSPTPTPTPIRILSAIATQSAFVSLTQIQASLSAGLSITNLDDPSLSPPQLELPLGFKP
ncbi:MAG: hypothetical protein AAB800_03110 [Patescibacteria group bacterium]